MNYRHIYHAGNFADLIKHLTLILCLEKFHEKPTKTGAHQQHTQNCPGPGRIIHAVNGLWLKQIADVVVGPIIAN